MLCLAYSENDAIACAAIKRISENLSLGTERAMDGYSVRSGAIGLVRISGRAVDASFIDGIGASQIIFVSRHSSAKGVLSLTTHATGNWTASAELGGKPREISIACPRKMLSFISAAARLPQSRVGVTYEATHHGPLLETPSLFAELGPLQDGAPEGIIDSFARTVLDSLDINPDFGKVALGIGGTHYPEKFTRLALSGKYAFAHIMPKHSIEPDMIGKAMLKSEDLPEVAVLDWKSIKASAKKQVLEKLEALGVDYEKA